MSSIMFNSCTKEYIVYPGSDGNPGNAFISLNYSENEPSYLEVGNSSVPSYFQWSRYYRTMPGIYLLYYEGEIWNGRSYSIYAWEVEYEVYILLGENGGPNYNGRDGADTYLDIDLSPYGPYMEYTEGYKLTNEPIVIEKGNDVYNIKIKYKQVTPKVKK